MNRRPIYISTMLVGALVAACASHLWSSDEDISPDFNSTPSFAGSSSGTGDIIQCSLIVDAGACYEASTPMPPTLWHDGGKPINYVALGDSTVTNYPSSTVTPYPSLLGLDLGSHVTVTNRGAPGQALDQIITEAPSWLSLTFIDGGINITTISGGSNDARFDAGEPVIVSRLVALGQLAQAAGYRVVMVTPPPPGALFGPTQYAQFVTDTMAACSTYADLCVDVSGDPELAQMTVGDGVHDNQDGHVRTSNLVLEAMREVLVDAGAK